MADQSADTFQGLMTFSVEESALLAREGFNDLLIGYPIVSYPEVDRLIELNQGSKQVTAMVDSPGHIENIAERWQEQSKGRELREVPICIDVDMSWRPLGVHIGARRSPIRDLKEFQAVLEKVIETPGVRLAGVMGYEAQIAGVPDASPFSKSRNGLMRMIKKLSASDVEKRREEIQNLLDQRGIEIDFFNGGGSGSLKSTAQEAAVTEVTVGSGLLQSHLFDYFKENVFSPALTFGLRVTRISDDNRLTCQGGGFIASGVPGPDRTPVVLQPEGLTVDSMEGFGEVQTPLVVPKKLRGELSVGDPVFFRPAKAGEIAERFDRYHLVRGGELIGTVKTYRGLGYTFH